MKLTVLSSVVCWCVFTVQRVESQEPPPAPTLEFGSSVNLSAITRYSTITVVCTFPKNTSLPVDVFLSHANNADKSPVRSSKSVSQRLAEFTFSVSPDYETVFVCWYRNVYTKVQSRFSQRLNVTVSALTNPQLVLIPPVFPVGAKYSVQCEVSQLGYANVTIHIYDRLLPIRPGKEAFEYIGSRVLLPGDTGGVIQRTNGGETYEFQCKQEVFHNGRTLRSTSTITAMPEELPIRLVPTDSGSGTCYGNPFIKVKNDWRPLCFAPSFSGTRNVANVICKDLGCGIAADHERVSQMVPDAIGTSNCTGQEKKIAECPIFVPYDCNRQTLNVFCSATLSPPKLSVLERDAPSRVYLRTEESVTLKCVFESPIKEAYIVFTLNGNERYTTRARSGYIETWVLRETVPEGEYACHVQSRGYSNYNTQSSNVIAIYIYDPPPAGAVAGGVITTTLGVIILVLLCVYRSNS